MPGLARPHPTEPDAFELVAGHRRFRACARAGVDIFRVVVRDIDDATALKVMLVESGAGIGLATVRRVVDAYGGIISVAGNDARGATFSVTLPLAMPRARQSDASLPVAPRAVDSVNGELGHH